jgi:DNA-binding Lrp family transcriptional regulator
VEQPENLKLLRSMAVALPLSPDPAEALAAGFRIPKSEMVSRLRGLREEGILLGVWGEPNPALADTDVRFGAPGAEGRFRWRGLLDSGEHIEARLRMSGVNSAQFLKAGTPPITEVGTEALLAGDQDRTCQIELFPMPRPMLTEAEERLAAALAEPLDFDPAVGLWEQVAASGQCSPAEVVQMVRRLVVGRYWRRIAARVNLGRAGWLGCGIARWTMDASSAQQAGLALAALRCTGDVWIEGTELSALFMARQSGEGRAAADEVARQWGRALARWNSLVLE